MLLAAAGALLLVWLALWFWTRARKDNLMIVLGSGGHTGEMMYMLQNADLSRFETVFVVFANCDTLSVVRFNWLCKENATMARLRVVLLPLPRPTRVHDQYIRILPKIAYSLLYTFFRLLTIPRVSHLFCNGPGVCIPPMIVLYFKRRLLFHRTRLVFIESFCRVVELSVSGRIARFFADEFVVHWEALRRRAPWAKYFGFIF